MRVLVVGNGMVGLRFVQDVLELDAHRRCVITVVGAEKGGAYNRLLLSNVLAGTSRNGDVQLADEGWYARNGVTLLSGRAVVDLGRADRVATLDDGARVPYDVAVLATGSDAAIPPIPNLMAADELRDGVVAFRTLDDCAEISARAAHVQRAVVVGGGLLGIEAARGLAGLGVAVTLLQRTDRLMDVQLDTGASRVLGRALAALGVEVVLDAGISEALVGADGSVAGLRLGDDRSLEAALVVLCCGVRPNADLARSSGLTVNRGVVVDDHLRSVDDRDVYAIGECAEHDGVTYGLVAPGWEQSRIVAEQLTGTPATYRGSAVVTRLKAAGLELAAMGESSVDDDDDVCFSDARRGVYQKVVVREGRLVGAILLGDTRHAGTLTQLFDRGLPLAEDRAAQLLMNRAGATAQSVVSPIGLPATATVCHCNGVTKSAICSAWQAGARSVPELAARTRATTGCGSCRDVVEGLAEWLDGQ